MLRMQIEGSARKFLVRKARPDITMEAHWDDLSGISLSGQKVFDSSGSWELYSQDQTHSFAFHSTALGSIPYKIAHIRKDFKTGEILLHRPYFNTGKALNPMEYPLDELLFVHLLALGKGAEIHGAGMVDSREHGYLFIGQSEAGKTTMARLWAGEPGITILSDDRMIVRKIDGEMRMFGTPWHGEAGFASPAGAPLRGMYFLSKGPTNELVRLRPTEAAGRLYAASFLPFYSHAALTFALSFFEELVNGTPCYELRFLPDKRVVDLILGN